MRTVLRVEAHRVSEPVSTARENSCTCPQAAYTIHKPVRLLKEQHLICNLASVHCYRELSRLHQTQSPSGLQAIQRDPTSCRAQIAVFTASRPRHSTDSSGPCKACKIVRTGSKTYIVHSLHRCRCMWPTIQVARVKQYSCHWFELLAEVSSLRMRWRGKELAYKDNIYCDDRSCFSLRACVSNADLLSAKRFRLLLRARLHIFCTIHGC